ncbi:hypothetical protein PMAYCL1PPCAC_27222 [Pristionchus mayeri]|uniref:Uncharacterized protein n=1 Tax=Pristionchus mayeri TaxID=1317129 RepID=A0AAN5I8Y0_9BILA|nr:hypothetical protein PMAYCL1PPCAC_27215 [Pristionchus mayeri]GMR57027.1 hypothetical protein PMAYCL1PPCAC_27222 [Pristionchus mayeri]
MTAVINILTTQFERTSSEIPYTRLYGKNNYAHTYKAANSANISVKWTRKEGSADNFALQIDVISKNGRGNV